MTRLDYRIWPRDSSTRFLPWSRDFIACHSLDSYLHEIVWDALIVYRVKNWRCGLLGHKVGPQENYYEEYWLYESWRSCTRPNCEYSEQVTS